MLLYHFAGIYACSQIESFKNTNHDLVFVDFLFILIIKACVKPIKQDDQVGIHEKKKVEITLGDCLACSGCITSAETVLISKQSYIDLYETLDKKKVCIFNL